MKIDEAQDQEITILKIEGDIDLHHSPELRSFLQDKTKEKCPALLVDFTDVNYIDSSGLATFVEYYQGCRAHSGKIAMGGMTPRVRSVFELVRLGEVFPILDSVEAAKEKLTVA
ncbi:MAG: STAS domain-containing protein [Verrucomicrobiota bacterium]